jgi:hypothetical protein
VTDHYGIGHTQDLLSEEILGEGIFYDCESHEINLAYCYTSQPTFAAFKKLGPTVLRKTHLQVDITRKFIVIG